MHRRPLYVADPKGNQPELVYDPIETCGVFDCNSEEGRGDVRGVPVARPHSSPAIPRDKFGSLCLPQIDCRRKRILLQVV